MRGPLVTGSVLTASFVALAVGRSTVVFAVAVAAATLALIAALALGSRAGARTRGERPGAALRRGAALGLVMLGPAAVVAAVDVWTAQAAAAAAWAPWAICSPTVCVAPRIVSPWAMAGVVAAWSLVLVACVGIVAVVGHAVAPRARPRPATGLRRRAAVVVRTTGTSARPAPGAPTPLRPTGGVPGLERTVGGPSPIGAVIGPAASGIVPWPRATEAPLAAAGE